MIDMMENKIVANNGSSIVLYTTDKCGSVDVASSHPSRQGFLKENTLDCDGESGGKSNQQG